MSQLMYTVVVAIWTLIYTWAMAWQALKLGISVGLSVL